ncbi:MAG: hypothetical protein LBL15_02025 [Oscillospiraceae bacterium]|jgi:hypothetical protein|nr:hypothetical protein [Oscillospiraceae bacterium]
MKNKAFDLVSITLFFVFSAFFLVAGLLGFGAGNLRETRSAAPEPVLPDGSLNMRYTAELDDYFSDNFAFRGELINAYSGFITNTLNVSPVADVILGRDGWLFYADTLDDYLGYDPMTEREVCAAARSLYLMCEYAEKNGAAFLFVAAPNKNTLYPEQMPFAKAGSQASLDLLLPALAGQAVGFIDLRAFLVSDAPLYYKNDSHWNLLGAAMAADAVNGALGVSSDFAKNMRQITVSENGDLFEMLYPVSETCEPDYEYAPGFSYGYSPAFRSPEDISIETARENVPGSLLMFRDSFGNALHTFMAESFGRALFSRSNSYRLDFIARTGASAVVVELVERNLAYLNRYAPVFPSPERSLSGVTTIPGRLELTVSAERSGDMPGYIKLSGGVSTDGELPADSPIYLLSGGAAYEATPAGEFPGAFPFTAYLPEDAVSGEIRAVMVTGATALISESVELSSVLK